MVAAALQEGSRGAEPNGRAGRTEIARDLTGLAHDGNAFKGAALRLKAQGAIPRGHGLNARHQHARAVAGQTNVPSRGIKRQVPAGRGGGLGHKEAAPHHPHPNCERKLHQATRRGPGLEEEEGSVPSASKGAERDEMPNPMRTMK